MGGAQPHPLGRVVVGLPAEAVLDMAVDGVEVDAQAGQQLGVAGLGAREHASGDQPVDLGLNSGQVQAMAAQQVGRAVIAVGNRKSTRLNSSHTVISYAV